MMFELASDAMEDTERQADALIKDLQDNNFGYALPKIWC
jgi:hypothetical protein